MPDIDDTDDVILEKQTLEHRAIKAGLDGLDRRKSLTTLRDIVEEAESKLPATYRVKMGCSVYTNQGVVIGPGEVTPGMIQGGQTTIDIFLDKGHIEKI